jgi:PAS domain-containing protein
MSERVNKLIVFLRMSAGLTLVTITALLAAQSLGLISNRETAILEGRIRMSEALALGSSVSAQRQEFQGLEACYRAQRERCPELESLALWDSGGQLLAGAGEVGPPPQNLAATVSSPSEVRIRVALGGGSWGLLQSRFRVSSLASSTWGFLDWDSCVLVGVVGAISFVLTNLYLWIVLGRNKDARGAAVPQRVRTALNTLAEGVLILDKEQRIALSNDAFARLLDQSVKEIEGRKVSDLPWDGA